MAHSPSCLVLQHPQPAEVEAARSELVGVSGLALAVVVVVVAIAVGAAVVVAEEESSSAQAYQRLRVPVRSARSSGGERSLVVLRIQVGRMSADRIRVSLHAAAGCHRCRQEGIGLVEVASAADQGHQGHRLEGLGSDMAALWLVVYGLRLRDTGSVALLG